MNNRFAVCPAVVFTLFLFACSGSADGPSAANADSEPVATGAQAMMNEGSHHNSCSSSQISGGYEDVDGVCLLTCWNCAGSVGGGSGHVPGGCTTPSCEGGGGTGGGGTGGGGTGGSQGSCADRYSQCFDRCPPTPVLPEDDTDRGHLTALRNAERCYDCCERAFDACRN